MHLHWPESKKLNKELDQKVQVTAFEELLKERAVKGQPTYGDMERIIKNTINVATAASTETILSIDYHFIKREREMG
jgi:hypothetical protein